ncbi:cytochrome C [Rhodanobacter thiooxydans]|uniref:Cytochrome C n=1 Tax=Rhodanobacter thiooxydans TaxID=416169 RepID=A0A154QKI5_9GAMM|nr:cytochrome c [Rhodanobacter thiooxydans]EIM02948.1 hypothetical protein UUA_00590 [Rhodanobacter thiooxydans LCS2]KZC24531.1 cytochrome C [Rhodanobacter thiooxydans]MCW0203841.1 cytochrome c [Rhodanobacter thiooxydans]
MSFTPRTTTQRAAMALAVILTGSVLLPASAANPPDQATPLALTAIMRDLSKDMQGVTDGLAREDWPAVAQRATRIADHPQPPLAEKLRILAFMGKDAGHFRDYDRQSHDAAQQLAQAAQRQDGASAIAAFANLQGACLGCHQRFRQPFREHFQGQP